MVVRNTWPLKSRFLALCLSLSFVVSVLPTYCPAEAQPQGSDSNVEAMQAAEILGVRDQVSRLLSVGSQTGEQSDEALALRGLILRRVLLGCLQVRQCASKINSELAYTYDIIQRQQRKQNNVDSLFNLANFLQFSVLYSIEGRSRIHKQFRQSAVCTTTGAGVGTALPTFDILYGKFAKARDVAPPKFIHHVIDGGPVDAKNVPDIIAKYLDTPEPGSTLTRRQEMFALWKKRYGVDATNSASLCSLRDGKSKSIFQLNKRIVLLWSLHTTVEHFDKELVALLELTKTQSRFNSDVSDATLRELGLSAEAIDAANLLKVKPEVAELVRLNANNTDRRRRLEAETFVLERVMLGQLDAHLALDKIDKELNYAFDVVLSQLLAGRGKWLQRNFEANFIHNGIFGAIAGYLYLKGYSKAGNEMFVISSGIGCFLSGLALAQMHGGWKKIDTPPNSLADFFDVETKSSAGFSPLISAFLNSPSPGSASGKTRKEELLAIFKKNRVSTLSLNNKRNRDKLAAAPTVKYDTIKIVSNRIALLQGLKVKIESLNSSLFQLLVATNSGANERIGQYTTASAPPELTKAAVGASDLLGTQARVATLVNLKRSAVPADLDLIEQQLGLTRSVLSALSEVRLTVGNIDTEIAEESQALSRLNRARDTAVTLTNNANFFQINILGIIIDGPLGLSSKPLRQLYSNRLTIISGLMAGGLACAAYLERRGGIRMSKVHPNMLGPMLAVGSNEKSGFQPLLLKFLNTEAPSSPNKLTRREELIEYWKKSNVLNLNVSNKGTAERLAATGSGHHFWNEDIKLLTNRVYMMYDVRAILDMMDEGLGDLLRSADS